ncbi:hypothetical protein ACOMHN_036619 [Nucella lapillus]
MWLTMGLEVEDVNAAPASPNSTPLDLSPNMAAEPPPPGSKAVQVPKTDPDLALIPDPDPDPERSADREAVALAMVTDLNKATGLMPVVRRTMEVMPQPRKKQRKRPREDEKICLVCGDKALAHNFDAITCESCKAFFRRNAPRLEMQNCMFTGECEVSIQTRRFCPACRLKKCFAIGMRADLILDDTERRARMDKVSENRARRKAKDSGDGDDAQVGSSSSQTVSMASLPSFTSMGRHCSTPSPSPSTPMSPTPARPTLRREEAACPGQQPKQPLQQHRRSSAESRRSNLSTLHAALTAASALSEGVTPAMPNIPTTCYPVKLPARSSVVSPPPPHLHPQPTPPPPPTPSTTTSSAAPTPPKTSSSVKPVGFQHVARDLLPSDPHMYWRLSEEEKTMLTQLSNAYQATIMTLPERVPFEGGGLFSMEQGNSLSMHSMEHIFETSEKNMRQIVNFVQRLGDFHQLREDDKIAVLQASCMHSVVLRWTGLYVASCMRSVVLRWTGLYVVERHTWLTRFGECSVSTASVVFGHEDAIQEMAAFCHATKTVLKNDVTLFVLTHCLILFDAREQNLVDRQLINTFRDKYLVLLKHYLESEYSFLFAEGYLKAIQDKVIEIRLVAERCMGIMKQFKDFISPLSKQLLNLQEIH